MCLLYIRHGCVIPPFLTGITVLTAVEVNIPALSSGFTFVRDHKKHNGQIGADSKLAKAVPSGLRRLFSKGY